MIKLHEFDKNSPSFYWKAISRTYLVATEIIKFMFSNTKGFQKDCIWNICGNEVEGKRERGSVGICMVPLLWREKYTA